MRAAAAQALALSYAAAIGSGRVGILPTSFAEEAEADLFNEQAVLWGAIPELIHAGFETLVDAGFSPEIAYFECLTEVKLIADLIYERGIAGMREAISNTAEFGALKGGDRIVNADTRTEMRRILREVRGGAFVRDLIDDAQAGYPKLKPSRARAAAHPIEEVGARLRALTEKNDQAALPWIAGEAGELGAQVGVGDRRHQAVDLGAQAAGAVRRLERHVPVAELASATLRRASSTTAQWRSSARILSKMNWTFLSGPSSAWRKRRPPHSSRPVTPTCRLLRRARASDAPRSVSQKDCRALLM